MSRRTDCNIHHVLQVEWTLGSQDDIQVLLNNKTIQFSYSQGEQNLLLNVSGGQEGYSHPTRTSPTCHEGNHSEFLQTSPTCTLSLVRWEQMRSVLLPKFRVIILNPSILWALLLCPLADMDAEVYYSPGILLVNSSSSFMAVFDGAIAVSISATSRILSVVCSLPNQYHNSTKGLLGENFWYCCRAGQQSPLLTLKQAGKC